MNVEFKRWTWTQWNLKQFSGLSLTLDGAVDFEPVCVGFEVKGLGELLGVQHDEKKLREAVEANREFLEKIARAWIRAGRLDSDGFLRLTKEDLLPYFERRAATAPA